MAPPGLAPRHSRRQTSTVLGYAARLKSDRLSARLRREWRSMQQAPSKQKPPRTAIPEGFTNPVPGVVRRRSGRYAQSA